MKSMQRKFQRLMKRSADGSDVAVLLRDFTEADNLLSKFIQSTSEWRNGWTAILNHQDRLVGEFELLYSPIAGSSSGDTVNTPEDVMLRTSKLHEEYIQLRMDLQGELDTVEDAMIRPAMAAKGHLEPMKKTIKKREDRKLDYERSQNKYDNYANKANRSDRDATSMAKAETDLNMTTETYTNADNTLRDRLPHLMAAIYGLIPRLLATQIEIQNSMLANYYTILYNFSQDHGLPCPPVGMDQTVQEYEQAQFEVREHIENFACLANGKSTQQSQQQERRPSQSTTGASTRPPSRASSYTNYTSHSGGRRSSSDTHYTIPSSHAPSSPEVESKPSPIIASKPRFPPSGSSSSSLAVPSNNYIAPKSPPSPAPSRYSSTASINSPTTPMMTGYSPAGPRSDYFSATSPQPRRPSTASTTATTPLTPQHHNPQQTSSLAFAAAAAASKKKPPPPPPRPKTAVLFVTAVYDFGGQGDGDLAFCEGDKIRVLEKTESTDDWWEGELRGEKGFFPANYVE